LGHKIGGHDVGLVIMLDWS